MATESAIDWESLSDQALLRLYSQTASDEAFRQLVERHAALVLGTCRRGLHSAADADEAFQATFVVLARSARKIRRRDALAAWLYGVATRICWRMRRDAARRNTQELMDTASDQIDPLDELLARHDAMVVDEELNALPQSLRKPLVLRYLAGMSNAEVADQLGVTVAALEGRLKRGKQRLRMRLLRRGVTLAALVAMLKATRVAASQVPSELTDSAVALATAPGSATISSPGGEPSTSTRFALQELHAMNTAILSKPIVAALGLSGVFAVVITGQMALSQGSTDGTDNPFGLEATASEAATSEETAASTIAASEDPFGPPAEVTPKAPVTLRGDLLVPTRGAAPQVGSDGGRSDANQLASIVDLKPRSESEMAIENALARPLNSLGLQFTQAPLSEVVDFLRAEYDIEVHLDLQALETLGMSPDDPIDVNVQNISLESALNIMFRQSDLTYIVDNEVLWITTEEEAATRMETRAYPTDVLGTSSDALAELIKETVAPNSWTEAGSGGVISSVLQDRLVIRQIPRVHREINELLSQLKADASRQPSQLSNPFGN